MERLLKKLDVELVEGKTPFKTRTKLEVISPPEDFSSTAEFAVELISKLGQDCLNDGSLREVVREMRHGLLYELVMCAETNHTAIRSLSHETKDELETVDVKLSKIHSMLGKRGRDDGALSAFGVLQNLEEHVETFSQPSSWRKLQKPRPRSRQMKLMPLCKLAATHYSNCSAKYRVMRVIQAT